MLLEKLPTGLLKRCDGRYSRLFRLSRKSCRKLHPQGIYGSLGLGGGYVVDYAILPQFGTARCELHTQARVQRLTVTRLQHDQQYVHTRFATTPWMLSLRLFEVVQYHLVPRDVVREASVVENVAKLVEEGRRGSHLSPALATLALRRGRHRHSGSWQRSRISNPLHVYAQHTRMPRAYGYAKFVEPIDEVLFCCNGF